MKVYELMTMLEKMPAGAEVKTSICATQNELDQAISPGEDLTSLHAEISDVDQDDQTIWLQTDHIH